MSVCIDLVVLDTWQLVIDSNLLVIIKLNVANLIDFDWIDGLNKIKNELDLFLEFSQVWFDWINAIK